MIKSILSWSTALLVLCSGLLASCDDKDEGGGKSSCSGRHAGCRCRRLQHAEIHAHPERRGQMHLCLHQILRSRSLGRENSRRRQIRNRIGSHHDRRPRTQHHLPPFGSRLQRQGQRQGRNHRTHHLRPRRTPGRRSDARHAHFDDPFVHRGPDRPRNGRIRLSRKDRRDDRSHGRRDSPRRHRHRPDG